MASFPVDTYLDDFPHLLGVYSPFGHPALDRVLPKSPIGANSEARNLTAPGQVVDRARVSTEQVTKFLYRQNFIIAWHV
jgi:hypothetical protein